MSSINTVICVTEHSDTLTEYMRSRDIDSDLLGFPDSPNATITINKTSFLARIPEGLEVKEFNKPVLATMLLKRQELTGKLGDKYRIINYFEVIGFSDIPEDYEPKELIEASGFLVNDVGGLKLNKKAAGVYLRFSIIIKDIESKTHLTYCRAVNASARRIDILLRERKANPRSIYLYLIGTYSVRGFSSIILNVKDISEQSPGGKTQPIKGE